MQLFYSLSYVMLSLRNTVMVFNVHRNHKVYWGRGEGGEGGIEVGEEGDYIPIATLSPPE